jgi:hypothetical protein
VAPPNRGGAFLTQFFVVKDSYVVLVLICDATFVIFFCVLQCTNTPVLTFFVLATSRSVPPNASKRFEALAASLHPQDANKCADFLRHKRYLFSPSVLKDAGIETDTVRKKKNGRLNSLPTRICEKGSI